MIQVHCTHDPLVTPSTLDGMLARWASQEDIRGERPAHNGLQAAHDVLRQTIGRHAHFLTRSDLALYASLMATREPFEMRARFFETFDLLVRTRGPAVAVLRIRELHALLRITQASPVPATHRQPLVPPTPGTT